MQVFYSDTFVLPLPPDHRFPMAKYTRLRRRVETAALVPDAALRLPEAATDEMLLRVHEASYLERVKAGALGRAEVRRIGFPWSPELVERSRRSAGGTIGACRAALATGVAVNLAGGTHHAGPARGEGFCVFNDAAVAARAMRFERRARRIVVIDLDVHQGNGTAAAFRADPSVFTLSVHGAGNYPFDKETSDLDVPLPDGTGDEAYLDAVRRAVRSTITRAGADLAIYIAGADPYAGDRLGRLAVTKAGLLERDRIVFDACALAGLPVAVVMGGGYAADVDEIVDIHYQTVREAARRAGADVVATSTSR